MKQILLATCLLLTSLLSFQAFAGKDIHLNPNESKELSNDFAWTINATCDIQGEAQQGKIMVRVVEHTSVVNGRNLAKGESSSFAVKSHDSISVTAEPGAKVHLVNLTNTALDANCSV